MLAGPLFRGRRWILAKHGFVQIDGEQFDDCMQPNAVLDYPSLQRELNFVETCMLILASI